MYRGDDSWRNYCARFLAVNSQCYACGQKATVVDHLLPHKGDDFLFKKLDNHIPLCDKDHNFVSAKFDRKYIIGSSNYMKIGWLNSRRMPTDTWTPKPVKVLASYD